MGARDIGAVRSLSPDERAKYLTQLTENKNLGDREALRRAGYNAGGTALSVSKATVASLFAADPELYDEAQVARGKDINRVESRVYELALSDNDAIAGPNAQFLLKFRHPDYRQQSTVDVNHSGEVANPDVAAAIERFTSTVVRLSARGPAELPPGTTGG